MFNRLRSKLAVANASASSRSLSGNVAVQRWSHSTPCRPSSGSIRGSRQPRGPHIVFQHAFARHAAREDRDRRRYHEQQFQDDPARNTIASKVVASLLALAVGSAADGGDGDEELADRNSGSISREQFAEEFLGFDQMARSSSPHEAGSVPCRPCDEAVRQIMSTMKDIDENHVECGLSRLQTHTMAASSVEASEEQQPVAGTTGARELSQAIGDDGTGLDAETLESLGMDEKTAQQWMFRCESMKKRVKRDKIVYFMFKAMEDAGCKINLDFISCRMCLQPVGAALYVDPQGEASVIVCGNKMVDDKHYQNSVAHELIHAYDYCRAEVDFSNLLHHACTEIRASNLSGECHFMREVGRLEFGISEKHKVCVRRRAEKSVAMNPNCVDAEHARQAVDLVWDVCYNDHAPFGTQP